MTRCKIEHDFPEWKAKKFKNMKRYGFSYFDMTDEDIKEAKIKYDLAIEEEKQGVNIFFYIDKHITWQRKCLICSKEQVEYCSPYDKPRHDLNIKVKQKKSNKKKDKVKLYGRKLSAYKDEKISKGAQPW